MTAEKKLKSNIWKYALLLIANKRIFVAILGAYYLTIPDVTPKGIGIILLAGSLAGFIFEIPSGYVSDKIGHKIALVLSRLFMLVSTLCFLVASNIFLLVLGSIFMSIAHAFKSGTGDAFIYETLCGLKREKEYVEIMGKISSVGFAVPILFIALTPFLVSISFKTPFLLALVADLVGILAATLLIAPPVPQQEINEIRLTKFKQVVSAGRHFNFFIFALFSGIMGGMLFGFSGFRAPYQVFLEVPIIWYGIFLGIGRVFASLMLAYSGRIKEKMSLFSFYKFQLILYSILAFTLGFISIWWIVVIIFIAINAFQWGLNKVDNSYLIDIIKTSKFKATLLSVRAQIYQIVSAIVGLGTGFAIESLSYQYGFLCLGIVFLATLLPLYLYIINKHKRINIALKAVR